MCVRTKSLEIVHFLCIKKLSSSSMSLCVLAPEPPKIYFEKFLYAFRKKSPSDLSFEGVQKCVWSCRKKWSYSFLSYFCFGLTSEAQIEAIRSLLVHQREGSPRHFMIASMKEKMERKNWLDIESQFQIDSQHRDNLTQIFSNYSEFRVEF